MKLNTFTDYNLRVLVYLALHRDRLCTIQEVAQAYTISENHLMKVIHHLSRNNFIFSQRGKGGGIRLHLSPEKINLGEVIRLAEGDLPIVECLGGQNKCCIQKGCQLPPILQGAFQAFYQYLSNYTLADTFNNPHLLMGCFKN